MILGVAPLHLHLQRLDLVVIELVVLLESAAAILGRYSVLSSDFIATMANLFYPKLCKNTWTFMVNSV